MKKKVKLTLNEIESGWGSLEAYLEEQRRTSLCDLETRAFDIASKESFPNDFLSKTTMNQTGSDQPSLSLDFATSIQAEPGMTPTKHLTFIRWLYNSGRLES